MRAVAAYDVSALMKYKKLSLREAALKVVEKLRVIGGEGGLIAVDSHGNIALPFNSEGMYRGFISSTTEPTIEIYQSVLSGE
jgi:beta-aspartyl-peptidase (threonine type)